jgi:hypothetical protein
LAVWPGDSDGINNDVDSSAAEERKGEGTPNEVCAHINDKKHHEERPDKGKVNILVGAYQRFWAVIAVRWARR